MKLINNILEKKTKKSKMKSIQHFLVLVAISLLMKDIRATDTPVYNFRHNRTISQIDCDNIEAADNTLELIIIDSKE